MSSANPFSSGSAIIVNLFLEGERGEGRGDGRGRGSGKGRGERGEEEGVKERVRETETGRGGRHVLCILCTCTYTVYLPRKNAPVKVFVIVGMK